MNQSIVTIEWLAEQNEESYIQDGERVVVCDFQGKEIARGEFTHTGGSGWTATAQVGDREFTTWLVLPGKTVWINPNNGSVVYIYREALETSDTF